MSVALVLCLTGFPADAFVRTSSTSVSLSSSAFEEQALVEQVRFVHTLIQKTSIFRSTQAPRSAVSKARRRIGLRWPVRWDPVPVLQPVGVPGFGGLSAKPVLQWPVFMMASGDGGMSQGSDTEDVTELFPSFEEWMDWALHHPRVGFYSRTRIGAIKDGSHFNTWPQILSPHFGQMLAENAFNMWTAMQEQGLIQPGEPFVVAEFGGGTGRLAVDVLTYAFKRAQYDNRWLPFFNVLEYRLYEKTSALHAQQAQSGSQFASIGKLKIMEADARLLAGEKTFKGVIFSNELMDAFPHQKIILKSDGSMEAIYVIPRLYKKEVDVLRARYPDAVAWQTIDAAEVRAQRRGDARPESYTLDKETVQALLDHHQLDDVAYASLAKAFLFDEVRMPVSRLPNLAAMLIPHCDSFAAAWLSIEDPMPKEIPLYVNPGMTHYAAMASHLLEVGVVMTIDYGSSAEILFKETARQTKVMTRQIPNQIALSKSEDLYSHFTLHDITGQQNFTWMKEDGERSGLKTLFYGNQDGLMANSSMKPQTLKGKGVREKEIRDFTNQKGYEFFGLLVQATPQFHFDYKGESHSLYPTLSSSDKSRVEAFSASMKAHLTVQPESRATAYAAPWYRPLAALWESGLLPGLFLGSAFYSHDALILALAGVVGTVLGLQGQHLLTAYGRAQRQGEAYQAMSLITLASLPFYAVAWIHPLFVFAIPPLLTLAHAIVNRQAARAPGTLAPHLQALTSAA